MNIYWDNNDRTEDYEEGKHKTGIITDDYTCNKKNVSVKNWQQVMIIARCVDPLNAKTEYLCMTADNNYVYIPKNVIEIESGYV